MSKIIPEVYWAQRSHETDASKNIVYLTVAVPDLENPKVELTETQLKFESTNEQGSVYAVTVNFYDAIDVAESKRTITRQGLFFVLRKQKAQAEFWPRLNKGSAKLPFVKTDFDRWVDEDEQEEAPAEDADMGGMGGMGGMPGMGDMGGMGGMPGMGGLGGMGGAGGDMDFSKLLSSMGGAGGMPDFSKMGASADSDEDLPDGDEEEEGDKIEEVKASETGKAAETTE